MASVTDYMSSFTLSGLQAGTTYCYRVYTGGSSPVDLLGTDAAPRFSTLPTGSTMTFDVLGDWGDNSVAGGARQANVDALIARSGAQFAVSTGDIAYPDGTQTNYGDLKATGTAVSEVFGPSYWTVPGSSLPLFSTAGNHGRSTTFFQNWPQPSTVAASGGKYLMETYSGQDGTTSVSAPSDWYAFTAGNARFYIVDADWSDNNYGTASGPYQVDRDYHWQTSSPEYQWLKNDLAAHPTALKFAFFHFPLRADTSTQPSDTYLQNDPNNPGATNTLEGLLHHYGVDLVFNGHAHIYQRNVAPPGAVTSYVTGGGGGKAIPVYSGAGGSACSPSDAYAVGWSYTNSVGSSCGAAATPSSDAQVYHFLKVRVSGTSVTVTPTDSTGGTFDTMTYNFGPDTTAPAAPSSLLASAVGSTVKLSWTGSTSSDVSAQDIYRNGAYLATVVPGATSYTDRTPVAGASYTVRAHDLAGNQSADSAPASVGSGTDTTPPTTPTSVAAAATSATSIKVSWSAATDNVAVTGYRLFRDGSTTALATVSGSVLSYVDNGVTASSTHSYTVQAVDAAGNASPQSAAATATTPPANTGNTLTFGPTDDATIDATNPNVNYGTSARLTADGSPVNDLLLKFAVSGTSSCSITKATLQLTVGTSTNNNSVNGGDFYGAAETTPAWTQSSVTWNTAPATDTGVLASLGSVALGETVTVDVTRAVTADGSYSFRVKNTSSDAVAYFSKEGSSTNGPRLILTCG